MTQDRPRSRSDVSAPFQQESLVKHEYSENGDLLSEEQSKVESHRPAFYREVVAIALQCTVAIVGILFIAAVSIGALKVISNMSTDSIEEIQH